jgi:hypothetical protein
MEDLLAKQFVETSSDEHSQTFKEKKRKQKKQASPLIYTTKKATTVR